MEHPDIPEDRPYFTNTKDVLWFFVYVCISFTIAFAALKALDYYEEHQKNQRLSEQTKN
jgi:RsiW-degrading membrane proteinase PrsW (M82 family)